MNGTAFFNPHYLWALSALAIPIIIHFARRRQTVVLDFSTIRFMRATAVHASRMRWLKKLLLLLNRLFLVLVLVLLFAQPYRTDDPFRAIRGSNTALYCWIDPTISMSYTERGISLRHEACALAALFDTVVHPTATWSGYDERINDFIPLHRTGKVTEIDAMFSPLRHGPTDFSAMTVRFNECRRRDTRVPIMILYSDFQAKDSADISAFIRSDQTTFPLICVSLAPEHPWNYSLCNSRFSADHAPEVASDVQAHGRALDAGAIVALVRSMRTGQDTVSVPENGMATVAFPISHEGEDANGEIQLRVEDPCSFDNTGYFVQQSTGKRRPLIISDDLTAFPLTAVFQSLSGRLFAVPIVRRPLEVTYEDLDSSDLIILNSVAEPTAVIASLCGKNAFSPKIIIFAPSIETHEGSLNTLVYTHLHQPNTIVQVQSKKPLFPVLPDTVSALWRGFPRMSDQDIALYTYITPLAGEVLLRLNNGAPLITTFRENAGSVWIVCATPIGITEANNLCETGFYVPLLDRLFRYGYKYIQPMAETWVAGMPAGNPFYGTRTSAQVFTQTNDYINQWDRQPQVVLEVPGLYRVQPDGKPSYWIASVADHSEGDCRYWKPEITGTQRNNVKVLDRHSFITFIKKHNTSEFEWLWLLLGLCLITEIVLWKKTKH